MSTLIVLFAITAAPPGTVSGSPDGRAELRRYHEINKDLREWMRREALAKTPAERGAAIRRLAALYGELRRDPRLSRSDTLKRYKAMVWSRLTRVKKNLQSQIARKRKLTSRNAGADDSKLLTDNPYAKQASQSLAAQMALISYSLGGPARVFAESGGALGGAAMTDHGEELVELIERTIQPDFWDTNGGPGSIVYYRPLMALVVSATSEVHERIGGVAGGLRAAGR